MNNFSRTSFSSAGPVTAGIAAAALVLVALAPVGAANAADLPVSGTVTLDGAPVSNVEVGWYDPTADVVGETVTDAAGNYAFSVADGHPYVLYAGINHQNEPAGTNEGPWTAIGGDAFTGTFLGTNGADLRYQGRTAFTTPTTAQNIALGRPGSVTATEPSFAKTRISLTRTDGYVIDTKKADAAGSVRFTGLIPGSYQLSQQSSTSQFAPWSSPTVTVAAGAPTVVAPVLERFGTISGVITNKGKPVKGIKVSSFIGTSYGDGDVTDSKGRYSLTNPAGDSLIVVENGTDDGSLVNRPVIQTSRTIVLAAGEDKTVNIRVQKGGAVSGSVIAAKKGFLFVRVLDSDGDLVGGTFVEAKSTTKPTRFTIKAVETGKATVYVTGATAKVFGSKAVTVRAGKTNTVGTIAQTKKTITLSGKVTGLKTGAVRAESKAYGLNVQSTRIKNGTYTIKNVVPAPGTSLVVESVATNVPKSTKITTKKSAKKNLTAGPLVSTLTGTFTAGGYPVPGGQGNISSTPDAQGDLGAYDIAKGVVSSKRVRPGSGTLDLFIFDSVSPFVSGSPFVLSIPAGKEIVTFRAGQPTDLGAVELTVSGQ
jgi:hypothetical protein